VKAFEILLLPFIAGFGVGMYKGVEIQHPGTGADVLHMKIFRR
jgi:hypothetical protein